MNLSSTQTEPVRIYSHMKASPEKVFDAWLDPKSISRWMFAANNDKVLSITTKAFPDTNFSFVIEREGKSINHHGTYIEVRRPHRLVFTWGVEGHPIGESRVAIDFEPNEGETNLTLTHRGVDLAFRERTQKGWEKILDCLNNDVSQGR